MGQEITHSHFSSNDFELFSEHLRAETALLHQWTKDAVFEEGNYQAGFELEAWLVDNDYRPSAGNDEFLKRLSDPMVVPELARFNFELNGLHRNLDGKVFTNMHTELHQSWQKCSATAQDMQAGVVAIGTLPTAKLEDFTLDNMSLMQRYRALNEQVMRMRAGKPLHIKIQGRETLGS